MAFSLHDAVRVIQIAHRDNLSDAARAEAAGIVESRVKNISRGKDFQNLTEADRDELVQETLLRVIQSSKALRGQNDGAATLYLHRTFQRVFFDRVAEGKPAVKQSKQRPDKENLPEPTARPRPATLRLEGTMFEFDSSDDDRPSAVQTDHIGPEDTVSAQEGLKWAWRELFRRIMPELPGDYARGLDELRRLRFGEATIDDLLAEEGIHSGSSQDEFKKARDRIYARRHRTPASVLEKIKEYEDEGERYYLLLLMAVLRRERRK